MKPARAKMTDFRNSRKKMTKSWHVTNGLVRTQKSLDKIYVKLEMRSVERGICPIATSMMNELFQ